MAENHHLLQPLLLTSSRSTSDSPEVAPTVTPTPDYHKPISSNHGIVLRLALVIFVGIVSIWANHEASKGLAITIVNESNDKGFQLFYVSNDEATRMIIKASKSVEKFFYHDDAINTKKLVKHVILRFTSQNFTGNAKVDSVSDGEFVLVINPSVMGRANFSHVMSQIVQQSMVHIWMWDGQGKAPENLINGIAGYVTWNLHTPHVRINSKGSEPVKPVSLCNWKHEEPSAVAEFLDYWEGVRPGFIRRLNQGMKDEWDDGKLEMALGLAMHNVCARNVSGEGTTFAA